MIPRLNPTKADEHEPSSKRVSDIRWVSPATFFSCEWHNTTRVADCIILNSYYVNSNTILY